LQGCADPSRRGKPECRRNGPRRRYNAVVAIICICVLACSEVKGPSGNSACPPEAMAYFDQIRRRIYEHWKVPADVPPGHQVRLQVTLDLSGAITSVSASPIGVDDPQLAASAVEAVRAAEPFPPRPFTAAKGIMPDSCLDKPLVAIFRVERPR